MRIELDEGKCCGLGMCEAEAPDLFEVQDDGSLAVLNARPGPEQLERARAACSACPAGALQLVEA
ncbi:ferredoxin [Amycolatopsis sp. GM8]|uniref:ferredoxin n=1 Tax=Amycolatopsis sp. GM8 TaxID=2896530 RepID=UPI001F2A4AA1|nr:ferredoxin [Amycolatopsis sp. GM8]